MQNYGLNYDTTKMENGGDLAVELTSLNAKDKNQVDDSSAPNDQVLREPPACCLLRAIWAIAVFILLVILVATNFSLLSTEEEILSAQTASSVSTVRYMELSRN